MARKYVNKKIEGLTDKRYLGRPCKVCGNKLRFKSSKHCIRCVNSKSRVRGRAIRTEVILKYGGKCSCPNCPETNFKFMTIDHIKNRGKNKERKHAYLEYRKIKKETVRHDKYRVLCYNCNCGRQANGGICPHEEN